eukprot:3681100-Alexandrium_andersonii.AAC.1
MATEATCGRQPGYRKCRSGTSVALGCHPLQAAPAAQRRVRNVIATAALTEQSLLCDKWDTRAAK